MKIELKQIKDYSEYYVDENGNIYRKLKPYVGKNRKYAQIALSRSSNYKSCNVHRIVAETFLGDTKGKSVHHKNGIYTDNRVSNLEIMDENEHRGLHVKNGENRVHNFIECELYKNDEKIGNFKTIRDACKYAETKYGISYSQLNKKKNYKGFKIVKKGVTTISKESRVE